MNMSTPYLQYYEAQMAGGGSPRTNTQNGGLFFFNPFKAMMAPAVGLATMIGPFLAITKAYKEMTRDQPATTQEAQPQPPAEVQQSGAGAYKYITPWRVYKGGHEVGCKPTYVPSTNTKHTKSAPRTTTTMCTSADYCAYYQSQMGGQYPVFRGGLQSGAGLGDILRGLFRFIAPIALRGIGAFAGNTIAATTAGVPLGLAAKTALGPAFSAIASAAAPGISKLVNNFMNRSAAPAAAAPSIPMGMGYGPDTPEPEKPQKGAGSCNQYKRDTAHEPEHIAKSPPKSLKRKQPNTKAIHYNF